MSNEREVAWAAAGVACAALVKDGMRVGLGTGRAANAGIVALGERVRTEGLRIVGVATSERSEAAARDAGISTGPPGQPLDLAFDGADAIDPTGLCVKGAGGAMVRERVLAESAARFLVLVDGPKIVASLDEWGTLPLAVVPFAADRVTDQLADFAPTRRDVLSDDGMVLIDLHPAAGADWESVAHRARALPGVLDHGLFRLVLSDVLVGHPDGSVTSPA